TAEEAVAAGPREADFHMALSRAFRAAGRLDEALASARRALAARPGDMDIWRIISYVLRRGHLDAEMAGLVDIYNGTALDETARMHLAFALGKWFEDIGEFDRSFACFSEANALHRRSEPWRSPAVL